MAASSFAGLLRHHRLALGLTQEELAERAGLSGRTISDLERGLKQAPRPSTVRMLVRALGLETADSAKLLAAAQGRDQPLWPPADAAQVRNQLASQSPPRLAQPPTKLIGRESEQAAIADLLVRRDTRILTLTGVGGVGKTRLALCAAERVVDDFVDGVQPVPLAALNEAAQAVLAIAHAVGVHEQPGIPLLSTLVTFLDKRSVALVLDNCEHLLSAAPLIAELLAECPRLKVLATSRAPLRIYGERVFPVLPLRCPTEPSHDLEALSRCPSVQLLIERARDVLPDFTLTAANAPSLAQIAVRLDGLPLAIELAAARLPLLPPAALLARLDQSMDVLVGGPRDRPPRQQTLRDTIDWSYQLLSPAHQALFRQLGVFAGGWSIEAAQAVYQCPDGRDDADVGTLDGLAVLMDASLIRRDPTETEPRFGMLETIREFAVAQLVAVGEAEASRARHASYFVVFGEQAAPHLGVGAEHTAWLHRLTLEQDNLRAALRWCVDAEDVDQGLRLAGAVARYWYLEGSPSEGQEWFRALLRLMGGIGEPALRRAALNAASLLAQARGDVQASQALLEENLAIARQVNDQPQLAAALHNLGALAARRGEPAEARRLLEEAAAIRTADNEPSRAITYNLLGTLLVDQGDFAGARTWYARSLPVYRELSDRSGMADTQRRLGFVAAVEGDLAGALAMCEAALINAQAAGNRGVICWSCLDMALVRLIQKDYAEVHALCAQSLALKTDSMRSHDSVATALQLLAAVASENHQPERAVRLFGAASVLLEASNPIVFPWDRVVRERWQSVAAACLGDRADAVYEAGRGMPMLQAIAYALEATPWHAETVATLPHE